MGKTNHKEPSIETLRNDRSNHLGNAQNHLYLVVRIARRFRESGIESITDQDVYKLIELGDKCSNTLKKYLNARNFMSKDQLLKAISDELAENLPYSEFDNEIAWLSKFGEICVQNCSTFIHSEINTNINSMGDFYNHIVMFREGFNRVYDTQNIKENFEEYLNEILKIAIGTALVCEDGLKYYKPNSTFSARSVWLGSRMFFHGATSLLESSGQLSS
jgi:hypothetical protein